MKPILFNTEMVKAILEGRKTVTRRIIKQQPPSGYEYLDITSNSIYAKFINQEGKYFLVKKPYIDPLGEGNNVLYVRETWQLLPSGFDEIPPEMNYIYKASDELSNECTRWRPSIHMPKEAARIFLRVKSVRVERLKDMCVADCVREGVEVGNAWTVNAKPNFIKLWNSTVKKTDLNRYGWDANPWVWVIEFERISKEDQ